MTVIAINAGEPVDDEETPMPWRAVVSIVVIVLITFAVLAKVNQRPAPAQANFSVINLSPTPAQSPATSTDATTGANGQSGDAQLYREACAGCHGPRGEGVTQLGTALIGSSLIHTQSDTAMLKFLRAGRAANDPANKSGLAMPPSGGRPDLSDAQLLAIIHYLHNTQP